ncbi:MAG: apolipoprotein N-acyltransferase [Elusimicrobia bacterium]|nr:apolipoprotein N-acyltransferase [Candidatus Liberimonas magnetica]
MIDILKKYQNIPLSLISGILIFLSFPKPNLYLFAWIALIPLLMVISNKSIAGSFFYGLFSGIVANASIIYWIYPLIKFNTNSSVQASLCLFLLSGYMALYVGVWASLLRAARTNRSVFRFSLFAAALWVSLEYLRTYLLTGFPWALLGYSQWKFLPIIQVAEYTGVYGVSFLLIWVNVGIYQFIKTRKWVSFYILICVFLAALVFGYSKLIINRYSSPPYISVAVIQANIDQYKKWDPAYEKQIIDTYNSLIARASEHKPDLVIWPETAVPGYLPSNALLYSWVNEIAKHTQTYHFVGSPYYNGGLNYYNSVILFNSEGEILGWHKKNHLVPFGEFIPFRKLLEPYFSILNTLGDFTRGDELNTFSVKSVIWGVTICSENFFGDIVRKTVLNGAEVLTNQTNDAWYFKTSAPMQHFLMNVFRAVENRRTIVVCGNTGVSGIVEPNGIISKIVPILTTTYFISRIEPNKKITFYTRWGDLFSKLCILITLIMLFSTFINRKLKLFKNKLAPSGTN